MNKRGLYEIKAEEVEVETRSVGKPSSPHANSPGDSQCAQSSVGDAQTQSAADPCDHPCDHPYAQISTVDTQIER